MGGGIVNVGMQNRASGINTSHAASVRARALRRFKDREQCQEL
jgi:hypothetical protein